LFALALVLYLLDPTLEQLVQSRSRVLFGEVLAYCPAEQFEWGAQLELFAMAMVLYLLDPQLVQSRSRVVFGEVLAYCPAEQFEWVVQLVLVMPLVEYELL
jgi:hypothetical protein